MNPLPVDLTAFRVWEHAAWQNTVIPYHHWWQDLSLQAVGPLLDIVRTETSTRLLDVATGPGYAAAAAVQRGADAIGIDFAAAMVTQARQHFPSVAFLEGDAEALAFPANHFDAVVSNFGILHFGQPEQALREAQRVLRPAGRIGFTTRAKPDEALPMLIVQRALQTYGDLNVAQASGPSPFRFSDPMECRRVLFEADFTEPQVIRIPQLWRLPMPDRLLNAYYGAAPRLGAVLRAQTAEVLNAIRQAIREATQVYRSGDWIELPTHAILVSAVKPL